VKILFVIPTYKPAYIYGGTTVVTAKLAEELAKMGHSVTVYTTSANGDEELPVDTTRDVDVDGVTVRYFRRLTKGRTFASPALWRQMDRTVREFDVVHIHSWWNLLIIVAAWICTKNGMRPVMSPHGMFSDYILTARNRKKKRLLHRAIGRRLLSNTYYHVSTQMEEDEAKMLIPDWSGEIVPNLVTLPQVTYGRAENRTFTLGFLSRIDPKKGLDLLIRALARVDFPYRLLVAGSGEPGYVNGLVEISEECGNRNNIEWVGWKDGEEKFEFLSQLDLFALTSHSENFAIVVIESLSVGTPVLISDQVGLFGYILNNQCGWVCEPDIDKIVDKLNQIYAQRGLLNEIGDRSRFLIERDFEPENLARQYIRMYKTATKTDPDAAAEFREAIEN
jgi:glycosyltransferase involved in cell wall biosynthesis